MLPPSETSPYSGGSFTHTEMETYPSEDDPFGTGIPSRPSLPDGQDTGIPDYTPPEADIPPVLEARTLQSGKHTLLNSTKDALNDYFGVDLHHRVWGRFLEDMKKQAGKPADDHGRIEANGDCYSEDNTYLGNFGDYL